MLASNATGFLTSVAVTVLAVMTVMTAVGRDGVAEAGRMTDGQLASLKKTTCPPYGTTVDKAMVSETWEVGSTRYTLLHLAAVAGCTDLARVLLQLQADKLVACDLGNIPLHLAAAIGAPRVVALLLADGDADRQRLARNKWGYIPLHNAVLFGRPAVVRLLVANCANSHLHAQLAARTKRGSTPLKFAIRYKETATLDTIAGEIIGRNACPSNPAFITQMLRGQADTVTQEMARRIADLSSETCTDN